jgi:prepilin-type N-terminal cleavage/methylation domain-containing protein
MKNRSLLRPQSGFSLTETLLVLALLSTCFAIGGFGLARGLAAVEARGAAASWQAAATWAQIGAVWQGEAGEVRYGPNGLSVATDAPQVGGDLGSSSPSVPVFANVVRWREGEGVVVRFVSGSGSPDSAGSLYFRGVAGDYRVTVRMESGLTVRSRVEPRP